MTRFVPLLACILVLGLGGCRPSGDAPPGSSPDTSALSDTSLVPGTAMLTGEVFYLPRIALPAEAEVEVVLQEVGPADSAAVEVASTLFRTEGKQVPFPFSLAYEPAKIDAARRYALVARISNAGELLWTSEGTMPVLTQGAPVDSIRIKVAQVPKS